MMKALLATDFLKIKRKAIWFLIFLGPFGVILLQSLNFGIRYDWLTQVHRDDLWGGLLRNVSGLAVPALLLGTTIIASMIASIEHATNAWKQTLALPVTRTAVFASKFTVVLLLLFCSSTLLGIGAIGLGLALGFGAEIPYGQLLELTYYPYFAAIPVMALQVWLSVTIMNQAISQTLGILGTMISLLPTESSVYILWNWPYLMNPWDEPIASVLLGVTTGIALFLAGCVHFVRRDVS